MTHAITLIRSEDAPRFDIGGVEFLAGAAPSRASSQLCTWTILVAPGHDSPQAHTLDRDEVFTVLEGTIRLAADGQLLDPGDTAVVPAGEPIRLSNPSGHPARVQVAITAGFTAVMDDGTVLGTPPWAQ